MGRTTYNKCKELLEKYSKGDEVGFMTLNALVIKEIGSDPRTTHSVLRVMLDTKLIKDIGNSHFRIL